MEDTTGKGRAYTLGVGGGSLLMYASLVLFIGFRRDESIYVCLCLPHLSMYIYIGTDTYQHIKKIHRHTYTYATHT